MEGVTGGAFRLRCVTQSVRAYFWCMPCTNSTGAIVPQPFTSPCSVLFWMFDLHALQLSDGHQVDCVCCVCLNRMVVSVLFSFFLYPGRVEVLGRYLNAFVSAIIAINIGVEAVLRMCVFQVLLFLLGPLPCQACPVSKRTLFLPQCGRA